MTFSNKHFLKTFRPQIVEAMEYNLAYTDDGCEICVNYTDYIAGSEVSCAALDLHDFTPVNRSLFNGMMTREVDGKEVILARFEFQVCGRWEEHKNGEKVRLLDFNMLDVE